MGGGIMAACLSVSESDSGVMDEPQAWRRGCTSQMNSQLNNKLIV